MPKSRVIPKRVFASKVFLAIALITPALAQNRRQSEPSTAASGPAFDVSVGYCYLGMRVPGTGTVNLNGVDASGGIQFARHWGAIVDSSYVRGSNVFGTGHDSYVLSALAGPVFYSFERGKARLSIRALGGAGLVDSAVPLNGPSYYLHGWVTRPSYAVGVGLERSLAGPFALRINGDYLRTAFVNSADVVQLQNNLRVTASIAVRLRH
jgi:hypothetical protein